MSKSNSCESSLLLLLFNNTDFANIGDAAGLQNSATAGSLYLSLHTSDPGEAGDQTTNEIAYTGYARVAVARAGSGFTVSGNAVTLTANADFPEMTGGAGGTVTHFGVGTASSGTGVLLYSGTTDPDIAITSGVIPRLKTTTSISED